MNGQSRGSAQRVQGIDRNWVGLRAGALGNDRVVGLLTQSEVLGWKFYLEGERRGRRGLRDHDG